MRRHILAVASVVVAALAGNWLGARLHTAITGQQAHGIIYHHVDGNGRKLTTVPVSANFYPALLFGGMGRPRWAFTFAGGFATSLVLGDALQTRLMRHVAQRLPRSVVRTGACGDTETPDATEAMAQG